MHPADMQEWYAAHSGEQSPAATVAGKATLSSAPLLPPAVRVSLLPDQIPIVAAGASVTIRNAKVEMYKGHMRLAVDQWGLIEPSPSQLQETVNTAENLSDTEYELVTVD
jgi:hypothetical protein